MTEVCALLSAIFSCLFIENGKSTWWSFAILDLQTLIFFVTWPSFKPKFVSAHRFSAKSDYLCLRYGYKTIIFKADADATIVVAGHFFKPRPVLVFPGYAGCNQRTQSERKPCVYLSSQDKAVPSFRKKC